MKGLLLIICCFIFLPAFAQQKIDLLIYNATVYTVDKNFSIKEAVAVNNGKIITAGATKDLLKKYDAKEKIDAHNKFIYPGLIDAHAHFLEYGLDLQKVNLVGTTSWDEIVVKLRSYAEKNKEGWLTGSGWDQNDWTIKNFSTNKKLNEFFPDRPVMLNRVDGHAVIVNKKALEISDVKPGDTISGGNIETINGELTGILIDNATNLVYRNIPGPSLPQMKNALMKAQSNCFAAGLTTIDDCGLDYRAALLVYYSLNK